MTNSENLLVATAPKQWAAIPECMTFSFAADAEECPRRAALRRSDYGELWSGFGYPPAFSPAAARGTIVHASLARIAKELANAGCESVSDPQGFAVLKRLGGYSAVLRDEIRNWVLQAEENPRLRRDIEIIRQYLVRLLPDMRVTLQSILRGTELRAEVIQTSNSQSGGELHQGSYFEVSLRDTDLGWKGFADFVEITETGAVAITDFKTGEPKDQDKDQLQIYALLWARDRVKNPKGRLATELLLQYPGATKSVAAPDEAHLLEIEQRLKERTTKIHKDLSVVPPPARINEACTYCDVRQLCEDYWKDTSGTNEAVESHTLDCEVSVMNNVAFTTWRASVVHASIPLTAAEITIHFTDSSRAASLQSGDRIRLMRIRLEDKDSASPIVTVRHSTEVFVVPQQSKD